ncbi:MAG TPA: SHOCT domain-containing protein [Chloroflexota bacterium]|jgi:putative membrane protein
MPESKESTDMMGYGGDFGWMAGVGGLWMILGPLLWLAAIALVVWAVTAVFGSRAETRPEAVEILKRRYAAGEITQAEFETARRALAA